MIWLTPDQLKDLGVSKGILNRNRSRWTWRNTGIRGRNGKFVQEVLLESLQPDLQQKYLRSYPALQPDAEESSLTTESISSAALRDVADDPGSRQGEQGGAAEERLTQALVRYQPGVRDSFLNEAQRLASIVERFDAIQPKQRRGSDGKLVAVPEVIALCDEARCTDPVILAIEPARGRSRSVRTLYSWSKDYKTDRLAAFLRKPPEPSGAIDKRRAEISAAAREWVNNNWRKKPSPRKLYQALKKEAARHGWVVPSEGYFWRLYQSLGAGTRTRVFEGEKAYTSKYAAYLPRTVEDLAALQVLVGDHSVRDVSVMLPTGELVRPWLTLWQDLRTGLLWGWHLDVVPSSDTIALAYANGVQTFGAQPFPDPNTGFRSYLYTDQGKDYRSKRLTGEKLDLYDYPKAARVEGGLSSLCKQQDVGLMDELGIKHLMARPYNAREKMVERTHKDISHWEQNTFEVEYCGKDTGHRPERWRRAWTRHEKLRKQVGKNLDWLTSESPFMTLDSYRDNLAGWIDEYNRSAHKRTTLGGSTVVPMLEYERLYTTRYEISDQALAMLLMRTAKRKIGKIGVSMFQSHWHYMHEEMAEFKGREIEVRYTDDRSRIWAILPNAKIVEAELVERTSIINPNKQAVEFISKQKAYERRVDNQKELIDQSRWRGETVEDRVAAIVNDPDDVQPPEQQKIAVNAQPRLLSRFDRKVAAKGPVATAEDFEGTNVIEGLFSSDRPKTSARIKEEWED